MWPRLAIQVLVLALVAHSGTRVSPADDGAFKVIVNPENEVDAVDRDFLRDAYLKKVIEWGNGNALQPIDLPKGQSARTKFTEQILRKTPAQLRTYWSQQIFSGKGVPPPAADSADDVIAYVLANPGAIGYLPADVDPGNTKVIRIK